MKEIMAEEVERILQVLLSSERVCKRDLENMLTGYTSQEIALTIWRARERLRCEHGIDLIAKPIGYLTRATPVETVASSLRQRRAGGRKQDRAAQRIRLASDLTADEKESERLGRLADRAAERAELARRRI